MSYEVAAPGKARAPPREQTTQTLEPYEPLSVWSTTMQITPMLRMTALTMSLIAPGVVLAQGGASGHMQLHATPSYERGAMREMHGMMSQIGGMMANMVEHMQTSPMTPEHTKQMGDMMGHMASMMQKMADMQSTDVPQHMVPMMEQMTTMQKQMMGMMAAPQPAPQTTPPQDNK